MAVFAGFQQRAEAAKHRLLEFLLQAKRGDRRVLAYGAAAKGNTLLNYAGIKPDLLAAVADRALSKQGKFLPGSHIAVVSPEELPAETTDVLLVLPWNLIEELRQKPGPLQSVHFACGTQHSAAGGLLCFSHCKDRVSPIGPGYGSGAEFESALRQKLVASELLKAIPELRSWPNRKQN